MIKKILAELAFLREFAADNGLSGYVRYRLRRLRKTTNPITIRDKRQRFVLRPYGPDLNVVRIARTEFSILKHLYPRDQAGVIIDAGGFIGSAALELSRLYPKARIITIEASSENFALLEQNIAGNDRIEAIHAALTTDDAPETLKLQNRQTGAWGFSIAQTAEGQDMEEVRTLRISDLMKRIGSETLLICKMDIEGAETRLLTLGAEWITRTNVLMIELHERIVPGCEAAFFAANAGRCVLAPGGEKFVSIGPGYLARQEEVL